MARILVVDDEPYLLEAIKLVLQARGHLVETAGSGEQAIDKQRGSPFDALVLDISLPGMNGVDTLAAIRKFTPDVVTVFITAHGSIASAVDAMRTGGFDYLPKPFDNDELVVKVDRALEHRRLLTRVSELETDLEARTTTPGIVGRSPVLQEAIRRLAKVAATDVSVLLTGETGTGKELAARTIHRRSERADRPFVAVNCGAITATLAESELFGHEKGAFTDARSERRGLFEQAQRGTVFLDEVGDLPLDIQVKMLRVLQEKEVMKVGGNRAIPVDVRVVAATNRDLADDVKAGRFREDLYWRLNVFSIEMPPLRRRQEDLPLLVDHLLERINAECRSKITGLTPELHKRLREYSWPGNVRELISVLKHGAIMAEGPTLDIDHVPAHLSRSAAPLKANASSGDSFGGKTLEESLAEAERLLIVAALKRFEGNRAAAAAALGISRRTLYNRMTGLEIQSALDEPDDSD